MEQSLSKTFDFLRFPLALLVIYLHIAPTHQPWTGPETYRSISHHIYITVNVIVCSIAQISVPCFFLMSAYLLGVNVNHLTLNTYFSKLKRRFFTLLMPYILWNIIAYVYLVITDGTGEVGKINFKETLSFIFFSPANFPLWFLRNLIIMNVLFPLFYWLAKYGHWIAFAIIVVLYSIWQFISSFDNSYVGNYTLISFVFFYLGMYFGINKKDICSVSVPVKFSIVMSGLLLFFLRMTLNPEFAEWTHHVTLLFCVLSTFIMANHIVVRYRISVIPFLTSATFYIYLSHKIGATYLSKQVFFFMPAQSYITQLVIFLACPLITSSICVVSFHLLKRIIPTPIHFLIGAK